jgi:CheY-like chemotaxis protein
MRHLMTLELEREGFAVTGAANGREALEKARGRLPDLVLTDVQMPVMDRPEITRRIREGSETSRIPVLIMSVSRGGKSGGENSCRG